MLVAPGSSPTSGQTLCGDLQDALVGMAMAAAHMRAEDAQSVAAANFRTPVTWRHGEGIAGAGDSRLGDANTTTPTVTDRLHTTKNM